MLFFSLDCYKQPQPVCLQMLVSNGTHVDSFLSLFTFLPHCIPAAHIPPSHPPTCSHYLFFRSAFLFFVPKLRSNSFLRAVLLEFNPPSLPFQPLFHCETLGSDLNTLKTAGLQTSQCITQSWVKFGPTLWVILTQHWVTSLTQHTMFSWLNYLLN